MISGKQFERRKKPAIGETIAAPVDIPTDYLKIAEETLTQAFEDALLELKKHQSHSQFLVSGQIYADEILLTATLSHGPDQLVATTVYASADFETGQEYPTVEDLLSACLDACGAVLDVFLGKDNPDFAVRIEKVASSSLAALEEAPFDWSKEKFKIKTTKNAQGQKTQESMDDLTHQEIDIDVWVKLDKHNPVLEQSANDWLKQHDPLFSEIEDVVTPAAPEAEEFLNERLESLKNKKLQ